MNIFIASAILMVIGAAYAVLLKRKFAETFFLAVVTVTGVLYCFGLINRQGCLLYGIYLIITLSVAGVIFLSYTFIKHRQKFRDAELLKGCLIYAGFLMFSLCINYGRTFQGFDEFSHWGFIVKHFYTVDALSTVKHINHDIIFSAYFPGTSLFQYFFTRFSNRFTEYYSYIGMNVMYFSLIMPFIKNIFTVKKLIRNFILLAVFIMIPLTTGRAFYSELYVDVILGCFFGFSLLYYFTYKYEESLYGILMVSISVFMLTLTKDMGLLFSLIVIGVIGVDTIFFKRTWINNILHKKTGLVYKLKNILLLIMPIVSSLFVKISWSNILNRSNIRSIWHIPTMNDIYKFFSGQLLQYQKEVQWNFFFAMYQRKIPYLNISVVAFSILIIVVILFLLLLNKKNFEFCRMVTSTLLLVMGLFGYQFILALMYVFSFSSYEGPRLAAYERYTSTYMLAMILFVMVFYVTGQKKRIGIIFGKLKKLAASEEYIKYKDLLKFSKSFLYILTSVVLLSIEIYSSIGGIGRILLSRMIDSEHFRPRPTAIAAEKWKPYFEKENPYFIAQGDSGFSRIRMRYELIPYSKLANVGSDYSISTKPYYTDDQWTFIITPEEWEKYVLTNGYKLLYIYKSDEILENIYGHYFRNGVHEDMCYYVHNEEGHLVLVPVVE